MNILKRIVGNGDDIVKRELIDFIDTNKTQRIDIYKFCAAFGYYLDPYEL